MSKDQVSKIIFFTIVTDQNFFYQIGK